MLGVLLAWEREGEQEGKRERGSREAGSSTGGSDLLLRRLTGSAVGWQRSRGRRYGASTLL